MDKAKIEQLTKSLLEAMGEDVNREGLEDTPSRVAKAHAFMFKGYDQDPKEIVTVFDSENYDEMIIVQDIEFYSFCEHHMLPFWGKAHIGYIPTDKIFGLSKLPRIVDIFARRLQNQERLTQQIANTIMELVNPKGVGVVLEAHHFCMMARGVEKQQSSVKTSAMVGLFKKNEKTRTEFLNLIS
ncbi:GTP cyclohydrolase I FolE [Candidatus Peregrinibacteria bacterium CG11_big_fil_rev_8_21_14_0_20_41_10]|nr:MAG: GTP cyclohydrolase I FolE [Candidatus Peregrinibacteria bacterium CG11_big_fil_rev_8_21_14_0_20_41_10]PIZ74110.1 MAG: GTP cyclohydrolase I FolE [Candidatus Peregrinibacteria bacterium CG_4_10_14_0_2_um_filter_41_8]PJC37828.1 MAG: GTP cyclohydrolase I FolE [Candidatus Peregrinibacteria bacterium CG_4_9_14_0_2_um_filter_41_14]